MRTISLVRLPLAVVTWTLAASNAAQAQSWSTVQRLNDPSENQGSIKEPVICPAANGGFHAMYRYFAPGPVRVEYRRYQAGSLSPVKLVHTGTLFGGDICEAGNGDIHIVWENWDDTPDIGWSKSSNGGLTFSPGIEITNFTNVAKIPQIAHFGAANGGEVVMSCGKPDGKRVWYNYYNGSNWAGFGAPTAVNYESEYEIFGICRSLQDGSVYRSSDNSGNQLVYQRFNGSTWTPSVAVAANDFYPRMSIAVNPSGQVMLVWEKDNDYWSTLYTPGAGWGPVTLIQSDGHYGMVTAIPGSNDFYVVYCKAVNRVRGRRWSGAGWLPEEIVSVNQAQEFTVNAQVAAGADGTLYACWEYWGEGDAQAFFSVKQGSTVGPTGTISGTVRNQFGVGVPGVSVMSSGAAATITALNGTYSLTLPAGAYNLAASKDYYAGQILEGVSVTANQSTMQDITITGQSPGPMASFTVTPSSLANRIAWQNPSSPNFSGMMIRYSFDAAPAGPTDGTLLVGMSGVAGSTGSHDHTGLTNGDPIYYSAFTYYTDASSYFNDPTMRSGTPAVGPDLDSDSDVDQADFGIFQTCMSGEFIPQTNPACSAAMLDADNDVDRYDLAIFQGCISGSGIYAEPVCAD